MKSKLIVIGIVLVFLVVGFSGCNEDRSGVSLENFKNKFIGTWQSKHGETMTVISDGTLVGTNGETGMWELKDGNLILRVYSKTFIMNYTFSNGDNVLTTTQVGGNGKDIWERIT